MFRITLPLIILLLFLSPAFAEVTKEDLREMEQRIKEYIDLKINRLEESVDLKMSKLEDSTNNRIRILETKMEERDKRLTAEIEMVKWMVGTLIVIIVAILAIPQAVTLLREHRELREVVELRERVTVLEKQLSTGTSP